MVICLNECFSCLSQISWLGSFPPQPAVNIPWEREVREIIVLGLPLSDWRPYLVHFALGLSLWTAWHRKVLLWSPGHPSCKCRLLCRCKNWWGLEKGWISMDSFPYLKVIQRGAHRHFIEFLFIFCYSIVAQSCPNLGNPMDWIPPGSSVHGISQARILEWGCYFLLQGIFLTQGLNLHLWCLLHWWADSLPLSHQGSLFIVTAPKYINKPTPCHLFKLFKKPELSGKFKEWYSQFYIYCFRK